MPGLKITREWMHRNSTSPDGSGFTNAQLTILGVVEKKKGWLSALIGTTIPFERAIEFERLGEEGRSRDKYLPKLPHERIGISQEAYKMIEREVLDAAWSRIQDRARGWMQDILSLEQIKEVMYRPSFRDGDK